MLTEFPSPSMLAAFLAASIVLALTPGPGVLYIVTRSATQGRAAGLASVAGVALGNLGNAIAASLGLAAIFAISSTTFLVVKYFGAAYLVYLGVRTLRQGAMTKQEGGFTSLAPKSVRRIFADGFVVALLNPKTALFFAAFLPQFVPQSAGTFQIVGLGVIFVLIAATTDTCYALASAAVAPWLSRGQIARTIGNRLSGCAYIGLGLVTAFTSQRPRS